jgi:hypothetical protein
VTTRVPRRLKPPRPAYVLYWKWTIDVPKDLASTRDPRRWHVSHGATTVWIGKALIRHLPDSIFSHAPPLPHMLTHTNRTNINADEPHTPRHNLELPEEA